MTQTCSRKLECIIITPHHVYLKSSKLDAYYHIIKDVYHPSFYRFYLPLLAPRWLRWLRSTSVRSTSVASRRIGLPRHADLHKGVQQGEARIATFSDRDVFGDLTKHKKPILIGGSPSLEFVQGCSFKAPDRIRACGQLS